MQKPLRELGLKKFWSAVRSSNSSSSSSQCEAGSVDPPQEETKPAPTCSLPLLQVWPSADSPRGEADGQSFVFPACAEDAVSSNSVHFYDVAHHNDSGIESIQASPSPAAPPALPSNPCSPSPSLRRPSSALLHPDHARFVRQSSPEPSEELGASTSSSTTSSLTSVAAAVASIGSRNSDPGDRRRSSTLTARYSLFDALDLEYALLRAAARGSVGPYSLSESLHKLTFTQSLAFPALARADIDVPKCVLDLVGQEPEQTFKNTKNKAHSKAYIDAMESALLSVREEPKGLAGKRRRSQTTQNTRPLDPSDSGLNAFAKVVTALVLVLVSVLVFGVVYKFVRT